MAVIYVYNPGTNQVEKYIRSESSLMPYANNLTVNEFRGSSTSGTLWTDQRTMEAWNITRSSWGRPIYVGFAFKRIWEGGHGYQSQHYPGMAFDMAQNLTSAQRDELREFMQNLGVWSYVEPKSLTPTWIHADRRLGPPACEAGYPLLRLGSRGVYVFVLQDALNALGYTGGGLDGKFGQGTRNAVIRFQRDQGLSQDGIVGCNTWERLTRAARGIGQTPTVVDP